MFRVRHEGIQNLPAVMSWSIDGKAMQADRAHIRHFVEHENRRQCRIVDASSPHIINHIRHRIARDAMT